MSTPNLRFKGFTDSWELSTLGNLSEPPMYGLNASGIKYDGFNKYIRITDIDENTNNFSPNPLTSPSGELVDRYLLNDGDIVFARTGASVGKHYIYKESDGRLFFAGFLIRFHIKNALPAFVFQFLHKESFERWVAKISMRTGQPGINAKEYSRLAIHIPDIKEQQKISDFLGSIDAKLDALRCKRHLLAEYKRGMMQKLFSQEIRFLGEDGKSFPEWEEKKLGHLIDYRNGKAHEKNIFEFGEYKLISLNSIDITGNLKDDHKKVRITDNSLKKGDLIMVLSDVAHGYFLGLSDIIPDNFFVLNQRMGALRPKSGVIPFFLKSYINFHQKYFKLMGQGSSQQNLSKGDILKFPVLFPSLVEQQKIADFLTAIDEKITAVDQQINHVQSFKKGLFQQMFV